MGFPDYSKYIAESAAKHEKDAENFAKKIQVSSSEQCIPHFDELMYCLSPAAQFSAYYYTRKLEPCTVSYSNLKNCLSMKLGMNMSLSEHEALQKSIQDTEQSPAPSVWNIKSNPSDTWNPLGGEKNTNEVNT